MGMSSWNLYAAATAAKSLQSGPTLCDPIDGSPPRLPRPWDSPRKNTGVGCHFLLQCMKVKSESEVAQSCLTLSDPMDCSPPGSPVHGIFQARVLEWGAIAFSVEPIYVTLFRRGVFTNIIKNIRDFLGGPVVKISPAMQGTRVASLGWEDSTCHGATKPMCHNY